MPKRPSAGFTLAELLIALLILAEIATFTIPKILYAAQQQQKTAIFKETLSTISAVIYQGYIMGSITSGSNGTYLMNNINAVKLCTSNAMTQGCHPQGGSESTEPGMVLHNGVTIAGWNNNGGSSNGFVVDWNGSAGSNLQGDDQMYLYLCYGTSSCSVGGSTIKPGTIGPGGAASITLYQSLFQ